MTSKTQHLHLLSTGRSPALVLLELDAWLRRCGLQVTRREETVLSGCGSTRIHPCLLSITIAGPEAAGRDKTLVACVSQCSLVRYCYYDDGLSTVAGPAGLAGLRVIEVGRRGRKRFQQEEEHQSQVDGPVLHAIADLRATDTSCASTTPSYRVLRLFCEGGDAACKRLAPRFDARKRRDARSANVLATTRLDFIRCLISCSAAQIQEGDWVLDPFAGSGAILQVASSLFRAAIVVGVDIQSNCCDDDGDDDGAPARNNYVTADSSHQSPFHNSVKFDVIVSDPPYNMRAPSHINALRALLLLAAQRLNPLKGRLASWWWCSRGRLSSAAEDVRSVLVELESPLRLQSCAPDDHKLGATAAAESDSSSWVRLLLVFAVPSAICAATSAFSGAKVCEIFPLQQLQTHKEMKPMDEIKRACWRGDLRALKEVHHSLLCHEHLLLAAGFGKSNLVRWLLERLDINGASVKDGETALIRAARHCRVEVVSLLLEMGASVFDGEAISLAVAHDHVKVLALFSTSQVGVAEHLLHTACQWGSTACLAYLLSRQPTLSFSQCATVDSSTPLHLAARYNHVSCAELLLSSGMMRWQLQAKDAQGLTPLAVARRWNRAKAAQWLTMQEDTMQEDRERSKSVIKDT